MKCQTCRDKDIELLTYWERIKNWLFYKLFPEDIADLSQNKFTQGFGDGYTQGRKHEAETQAKIQAQLNPIPSNVDELIRIKIDSLLSNVELSKIVSVDKTKGILYIGGKIPEQAYMMNLRSEAEFFAASDLWKLIHETPKELAQRAMFIESDNIDGLKKGRSMLYTLDTQKNIVEVLRSYQPKK